MPTYFKKKETLFYSKAFFGQLFGGQKDKVL
jgi:hypothetical protein